MSSTKRGGQRSEADAYATPEWATLRALEAMPWLPPGGHWMDPCAGDGAIIRATKLVYPRVEWDAVEIRDEAEPDLKATGANYVIGDFLAGHFRPLAAHVVFTNPPFRIAQDFIEKSLTITDHVVMLLRLNYLGSEKRADFLREYPPDVYVLPNRPSFMNGETDSIEYAWFHWERGLRREAGKIKLLKSTPKAERRAVRAVQVIDWETSGGGGDVE